MQTVAAFSVGLRVEVGWLGLWLAAAWRLVCIHQINRVNSRNGSTINIIWLLLSGCIATLAGETK